MPVLGDDVMSPVTWAIVALLIAVNALYVAAEFAAVGTRRSRIRMLAQDGDARAVWVLPIVEDSAGLDRYVAACQIGITLSSLVLGAFGQATLARDLAPALERLGGWSEAAAQGVSALIVLLVLTALQVILGELLPKSLALQFPTRALMLTVPPMRASVRLFAPFIWLLNGSGILLLGLLRAPQVSHRHIHSPDEIDLLIVESRDGGLLELDEQRRLHQALRLSMCPVSTVMVPAAQVVAFDADQPFAAIVAEVVGSPYSRLPVYRGSRDNVIGVLQTKQVALAVAKGEAERAKLEDLLRPVVRVAASTTADRVLSILRESRSQQAVVTDEHGGIAGLVTLEDVLEEVFGEVGDEFKGGGAARPPRRRRLPVLRVGRRPGRR
jgi:CBS domain containing-hemolysin-like protein